MPNKLYTVILIYPDHIATNYGEEFFTAYVGETTPQRAVRRARAKALAANELSSDPKSENYCNPKDFAVVAVFHGHHDNVNPE